MTIAQWANMEDTETDSMSPDALYDDISGQRLDGMFVREARMKEPSQRTRTRTYTSRMCCTVRKVGATAHHTEHHEGLHRPPSCARQRIHAHSRVAMER